MIDGKLHYEGEGYTEDGRRMPNIIIDTCKYMNRFETMVLRNSIDLACKYADTIEEAEKQYNELIEQYTVRNKPTKPIEKPLTGKYKKLSEDLKTALVEAKKADTGEDGGTCNFDAPAIIAPRWREDKVKQAAKEAGTSAFKWDCFGQTKFVFGTPTNAQGNRNTRVAEAMEAVLKSQGYETLLYMAMD
jgi:hypothetical protein